VEEIAAVITTGIAPDMPASPFLSDAELADVATYVYSLGRLPPVAVPGDAAKGRLIFERSGCLSCHILRGEGKGYGPELTNVGVARSADRLRQTLLDPKSTIPQNFLLVEVVTHTGQTLRGVRRNEDTLTLQLQDATGVFYSVEKSQLRSLSRLMGETPMPSFGKTLSKRQLDDLVAYLAQQGQSP
jgi:putative heme-binding domain-containing protein